MRQIYLDYFQEAKATTRKLVKQTRAQKIEKAMHQLAITHARKINDPMYDKMVKYRDKFKSFQKALHRRFASKVRQQARQ